MSRTITVLNRKGGVGKTSTATHLAGMLAASGYRTLVIDLDRQGDTLIDFGVRNRSDDGAALAQAAITGEAPVPLAEVRPGLDLVPGGERLGDLTAILMSRWLTTRDPRAAQETFIRCIRAAADQYDFTIIDSPPDGSIVHDAALAASRWVLVPTGPDEASTGALAPLATVFTTARQVNPELELLGIFLFGVGATSRRVIRHAAGVLGEMFEGAEDVVMTRVEPPGPDGKPKPPSWLCIRDVRAVAVQCRAEGLLAHELRAATPRPTASMVGLAEDYRALGKEVIRRIKAAEAQPVDLSEASEVTA